MASVDDFKVGDAVSLVSGGPVMTVTNLGDNEVGVQWWEPRWDKVTGTASRECGRFQVARFPPAALELEDAVDDEDGEDGEGLAS